MVTTCFVSDVHVQHPVLHFDDSVSPELAQTHPHPFNYMSKPSVPSNDDEALNSPPSTQWDQARQEQLSSCERNEVWSDIMPIPRGHKVVNLGFIYAVKKGLPSHYVIKPD